MSQSERKFTKFLATSVACIGLVSTVLLLTDPPSAAETELVAEGPTVFELNSTKLKALADSSTAETSPSSRDRAPASIEAILDLTCSQEEYSASTNEMRIRLKGESCLDYRGKPASTSVKNSTNGFIATVFHKSNSTFTTDYINLVEGENTIAVTFESGNDVVTKTLKINRSPASSAKN